MGAYIAQTPLQLLNCGFNFCTILSESTHPNIMHLQELRANIMMIMLFCSRSQRIRFSMIFNFIGSSGLGKSTLVNTLFKSKVSRRLPDEDYHIPKTVEIKSISHGKY